MDPTTAAFRVSQRLMVLAPPGRAGAAFLQAPPPPACPPARVMERSRRLWRPDVFQRFDPLLVLQLCWGHAKEAPLSISAEAWGGADMQEAGLCPPGGWLGGFWVQAEKEEPHQ